MSGVECTVWFCHPLPVTPGRLALLDASERHRLHRFRRTPDQQRFLTGRVLTRTILGERLRCAAADVRLDSSCRDCGRPHGPPTVLAPGSTRPPTVSISHSGERVAVAITDGTAVGIDVEHVADRLQDGMSRHVLSDRERVGFDELDEKRRREAFFTYWARKEALVKACLRGIALPMTSLTVTPPGRPPRLLASTDPDLVPERTAMTDLDAGEQYRSSLAVLTSEPLNMTTRWWHPDQHPGQQGAEDHS